VLLSDPRVCAVPVRDVGEPLTELDESFGHSHALVRASVARRLVLARDELPQGVGLRVIAGYRTAAAQRAIISSYAAGLRIAHPAIGAAELERLTSRFVAPLAVAPHVAGAAADLTLVDSAGRELDLGTPVDATPEQSEGACYFDAPQVSGLAQANRDLLAARRARSVRAVVDPPLRCGEPRRGALSGLVRDAVEEPQELVIDIVVEVEFPGGRPAKHGVHRAPPSGSSVVRYLSSSSFVARVLAKQNPVTALQLFDGMLRRCPPDLLDVTLIP